MDVLNLMPWEEQKKKDICEASFSKGFGEDGRLLSRQLHLVDQRLQVRGPPFQSFLDVKSNDCCNNINLDI